MVGKVYLIGNSEVVKIGISTNIQDRLFTIKVSAPFEVSLLYSKEFLSPAQVEGYLHDKYKKYKEHGEWFRIGHIINKVIKIISEYDEPAIILKEELFGEEIKQRTDNGFFEARSLERAGNAFRLNNGKGLFNLTMYLKNPNVKEFIKNLENEFGKVIIKSRGEMWVHPLLWIDIALAIDVNLKIAAYSFLLDNLVKFRLESGDSYKKMVGALYNHTARKIKFSKDISKLAIMIKSKLGVSDWETATEEQLKKRDRLHERIYDFATVMKDNRKAIEAAFDLFDRENQQE